MVNLNSIKHARERELVDLLKMRCLLDFLYDPPVTSKNGLILNKMYLCLTCAKFRCFILFIIFQLHVFSCD